MGLDNGIYIYIIHKFNAFGQIKLGLLLWGLIYLLQVAKN
jgi:hypothetical protein